MGHPRAAELREVGFRPEHEVGRQRAVAEDALLAMYVVEEELERLDALPEAALEGGPVRRRDHAGHEAEGEDLLGAARVATGVFRATMRVDLVNDGPVTLLVESKEP